MMDNSFTIYRNLSILFSRDVHIDEILDKLGIPEIYLYGIGEMGRIVLSDLRNTSVVKRAFDRGVEDESEILINDNYRVLIQNPRMIPDDNVPVIVTPSKNTREIIENLVAQGINQGRLISLNVLLRYGMYLWKTNKKHLSSKGEFLIVGANFDNRGSQAMTFVTLQSLRNSLGEDIIIWFCPNFWDDIYKKENYDMIILDDGYEHNSTVHEVIPRLRAIIDVSGYALTSTKSFGGTDRIKTFLEMSYNYSIPYYMMPQSFGPLDYPGYEIAQIKELLARCDYIFARERSGYSLLHNVLGLENIHISNDMVLQCKFLDRDKIYYNISPKSICSIDTKNNVALIPNTNLAFNMNKIDVVELYRECVKGLLKLNNFVYIIPHSGDIGLCEKIYEQFKEDKRVIFISEYMDCIDFSNFLKPFKFIVSSRYHAIVHAYKNAIPAIILGWADKYLELAELFDQNVYLHDTRDLIMYDEINNSIKQMNFDYIKQSKIIKDKLDQIQKENCFDIVLMKLKTTVFNS